MIKGPCANGFLLNTSLTTYPRPNDKNKYRHQTQISPVPTWALKRSCNLVTKADRRSKPSSATWWRQNKDTHLLKWNFTASSHHKQPHKNSLPLHISLIITDEQNTLKLWTRPGKRHIFIMFCGKGLWVNHFVCVCGLPLCPWVKVASRDL